MNKIVMFTTSIFLVVLVSGCTFEPKVFEGGAIAPNFIKNASHGMIVELGPNDVILAGRAGYEKNISGNIFKVQICEECGTENDCLQNNLNRLPFHNETALLNLTQADLKYFYVFAVIQNDVTNNYQANENIDNTYYRVFEQICNNKNYWAGIK